jgi:predicted CXXCH cytochrome family protein
VLVLPHFRKFSWVFIAIAAGFITSRGGRKVAAAEPGADSDPSHACAECHQVIYELYRTTPMANASGLALDGLIPADFRHAASGVHYRVFEQDGKAWLSYQRDDRSHALKGRQELRYFIGSGKRGRTFLFEQQGYWFESPINWYAKRELWDMAPTYQDAREMPLTLRVDPGCLACHASGAVSSLSDARNHYAGAPFASGGITCEACHGSGAAHITSAGKVHMLQVDSLEPVRRDSVCLSCHLEGQVAVTREGKKREAFAPGDNLFDYTVYFVHSGEEGSGGRATSQWEALQRSRCKQVSGDRMTCTTCHDPHGSPGPAERVEFYRKKCLQCHNQPEFAEKHHAENPDCTACHMGRPPSNDIAHEQVTDHWIKRRASTEALPKVTRGDLVTVGGEAASERDLGLAYAQLAARGDQEAGKRALELLRKTEHSSAAAGDHDLHAQLGFLEQVGGHPAAAAEQYRLALKADEFDSLAGGDLALIEAQQHHYGEAARLWNEVFEHDPAQVEAGMNLAVLACGGGQREAALRILERILQFAPDEGRAGSMLEEIRAGTQPCSDRRVGNGTADSPAH